MPPAGTPLHGALEETFAAAGVAPPTTLLTSTSVPTNIELLRGSEALGVQSGAVSAGSLARGLLAALPLKLVHDTGHVGLVWREASPGPRCTCWRPARRPRPCRLLLLLHGFPELACCTASAGGAT
jgi:hypothetical protein